MCKQVGQRLDLASFPNVLQTVPIENPHTHDPLQAAVVCRFQPLLLRLRHVPSLGTIHKCDTTKVLNTCTLAPNPKCLFHHTAENWAKAPSPQPLWAFTSAVKLSFEVKIPPKYLKLSTLSTSPPLMATTAGSRDSPLPTDITLVFAMLTLRANGSVAASMHCNISTKLPGSAEKNTMSSAQSNSVICANVRLVSRDAEESRLPSAQNCIDTPESDGMLAKAYFTTKSKNMLNSKAATMQPWRTSLPTENSYPRSPPNLIAANVSVCKSSRSSTILEGTRYTRKMRHSAPWFTQS